ncbi:hypothetical protein [Streptomonospora wellingtoniae]|uniref:Uncharacterized protein n=1 Tax=Streptomonospora wellingtoniae TaxID=3075544 RepID=A0ABU2KXI9_9ACTN|nr:hypothetical protein [Streptomonospora sp. DSM 45055]MDT0304004.1 hypothetical protein [Streptomonospora sp. DSM 45055]
MEIPRWLYIAIGLVALFASGRTAFSAVELSSRGFELGEVSVFIWGALIFLVFGVVVIAIGVRKKR